GGSFGALLAAISCSFFPSFSSSIPRISICSREPFCANSMKTFSSAWARSPSVSSTFRASCSNSRTRVAALACACWNASWSFVWNSVTCPPLFVALRCAAPCNATRRIVKGTPAEYSSLSHHGRNRSRQGAARPPRAPRAAPTRPRPPAWRLAPPLDPGSPPAPTQNLGDARLFINRELSWLAFNERVLDEGLDAAVPALERLKFLAIASSNLDEFFMIRVAGLKQQLVGHVDESGPDAMSPGDQLAAIASRCHEMVARQYRALLGDVLPNLDRAGVCLLSPAKLSAEADRFLAEYFARDVFPVLTPIALDPGHPFPHLRNKS